MINLLIKNLTVYIFIISTIICCHNRDIETKKDIHFILTNKTDSTISGIKMKEENKGKEWRLGKLESGKSTNLSVNIQRDLQIPEGGFTIIARVNNANSVMLNTGYFTNWHYQGPNPARLNIYSNRIELH